MNEVINNDGFEDAGKLAEAARREVEQFDPDTITSSEQLLSDMVYDYINSIDISDGDRIARTEKVRDAARRLKCVTAFNKWLRRKQIEQNPIVTGIVTIKRKDGNMLPLTIPACWNYLGRCICEQKAGADGMITPVPLIDTIIAPCTVLNDIDTGAESIELYCCNGEQRPYYMTYPRKMLASASAITDMAADGVGVHAMNAKKLTKFISDVIGANVDVIPRQKTVSTLGWHDDTFIPYNDMISYGGGSDVSGLFRAVRSKGSAQAWQEHISALCRDNKQFYITMLTAFASPLCKPVGANPFIVHLWGGTGLGKTVALKCAASVWGEPDALTTTMNGTLNSQLNRLGTLNSLPFIADEMQTIKKYVKAGSAYDDFIMAVAEGKGRGRLNREGKEMQTATWNCAALTNGEEPIIQANSGGGAINRVVQIELDGALMPDGNATVNLVRDNYGHAGRTYMKYIVDVPDVWEMLKGMYRDLCDEIRQISANSTDKQQSAAALLLTASRIVNVTNIIDAPELTAADIVPYLFGAEQVSKSKRAQEYIISVISRYSANFINGADSISSIRDIWGKYVTHELYINTEILRQNLAEGGYDFEAIKKDWAHDGFLIMQSNGAKQRYTQITTIGGIATSCVKLNLPEEHK